MSMSMNYLKRTVTDILHYSYHHGKYANTGYSDLAAKQHDIAYASAELIIEHAKAESDKSDKAYKAYKKYEEGVITAEEALRAIAAIYAFDV